MTLARGALWVLKTYAHYGSDVSGGDQVTEAALPTCFHPSTAACNPSGLRAPAFTASRPLQWIMFMNDIDGLISLAAQHCPLGEMTDPRSVDLPGCTPLRLQSTRADRAARARLPNMAASTRRAGR